MKTDEIPRRAGSAKGKRKKRQEQPHCCKEALEDAGNANDLVCIKNATGELIKLYRNIAEEIEKAEDDGTEKEPIDDESLKDAVRSLKEFAEVFDFDSVDFVMKELKKYRMPEDFKDKYSKLKTLVAQVDRDAIIELLKE